MVYVQWRCRPSPAQTPILCFTAKFFQFGNSNGSSLFPVWKSSSPCRAAQEHEAAHATASPEPSLYYLNASHSPHFLVKRQEHAITLTPSPNTSLLPLPSHPGVTDALVKQKVICLLRSVLHWLLIIFQKRIVLPPPPTRTHFSCFQPVPGASPPKGCLYSYILSIIKKMSNRILEVPN